jgi:hypothetical protein
MMRIGIDFDNTIVNYDTLFHKVAVEQAVIPAHTPPTKLAVRDHLRAVDKEDVWTEMQGYVYGARMHEAEAYPGVLDFMRWARTRSVDLCIISHKTRHPFLGPKYDLHVAAGRWVETQLVADGLPLVAPGKVHFELTKDSKLQRIGTAGCDWFIDDLPEILLAEAFPSEAKKLLFDPDAHHSDAAALQRVACWAEIRSHFESLCKPNH